MLLAAAMTSIANDCKTLFAIVCGDGSKTETTILRGHDGPRARAEAHKPQLTRATKLVERTGPSFALDRRPLLSRFDEFSGASADMRLERVKGIEPSS
jgi:hypothetical protein